MSPAPGEARAGTERLSVVAASLVMGLSSAALLPLVFRWQSVLFIAAGVVALSLLPFSVLMLSRRSRDLGRALQPQARWLSLGCVLLGLLALVPLWSLHRGQVRVLNHGEEAFALFVDERRLARVEPTSGESSRAGVELELPAGRRVLSVVGEPSGRELFRGEAQVLGGKPHLFAPASVGYCFRIERRAYGQGAEPTQIEQLEGSMPFWVLPEGISWFSPNPDQGPLQTSGGSLACVRQIRCSP